MSIIPGSTIGRFELVSQLGGGGMGSVYKARDKRLNRTVAIKVMNSQHDYDLESVERFEREAEILASLHHPNLMHVYDVGTEDNHHYFAMEYIEGRTLSDIISDPSCVLTPNEALRIIIEIMAALRKVHDSGIIHRDIKPANIMIENNDGRAVLVDFGLSKSAGDSRLTSAGSILGTPDYITPEQIEGFEAGFYSDIYSLGVVLYEMLSGENPFTRESAIQTIRAHCSYRPPALRRINSKVPRQLSKIVEKMIHHNPIFRYQNITELAEDLLHTCQHPLLERLATASPAQYHTAAKGETATPKRVITPYQHYRFQAPILNRNNSFWIYTAITLMLLGLLAATLIILRLNKHKETGLLPKEVAAFNLPVTTYNPDKDNGIHNPSVIMQLNNGEHIWGRIINRFDDQQLKIGLFPKGEAEYNLDQIESIIMADSTAFSGKFINTKELIELLYPTEPESTPRD